MTPRYPWFGFVYMWFNQRPKISLSLRPLKGVNLMEIPGLSKWLRDMLTVQVRFSPGRSMGTGTVQVIERYTNTVGSTNPPDC